MGKVETHVDPTTLSPAIPTHNPYCAYWVCLYGKKVFSPMGERVWCLWVYWYLPHSGLCSSLASYSRISLVFVCIQVLICAMS